MSEVTVGILGICVLVILFLTGIEMAFAMALVGFAGYAVLVSLNGAMTMIVKDFLDTFASYAFTAILFVLMGQISFNAGIAKRLYNSANRFMGHIPGGLALATVAGVTIFKTICGSAAATSATFASVAVPEMDRFEYGKKLSTGIVAVVGRLEYYFLPALSLSSSAWYPTVPSANSFWPAWPRVLPWPPYLPLLLLVGAGSIPP